MALVRMVIGGEQSENGRRPMFPIFARGDPALEIAENLALCCPRRSDGAVDRPPPAFVILALLAVALLLYAGGWLRTASARRRLRRAHARGIAGEHRAERLLVAKGYRVVGRQVRARYDLTIDGDELAVDVRANYVVDLGGARYVAEVKTGRFAPRLDTPATRRQLLEYRLAFDADGVLLIDADSGRISAVDFPMPAAPRGWSRAWLVVASIAGAAAALALEHLAGLAA